MRLYFYCFMNKSIDILKDGIISNVKWVNNILTSGFSLAGIIILLKIFGGTSFSWVGVNFPLNLSWIIFLFLTIAHGYVSSLIYLSIVDLIKKGTAENCNEVYLKITTSGGLFVRGMVARNKVRIIRQRRVYIMSPNDPSTWIAHIAAIGLFLAIIPFDFHSVLRFVLLFIVGIVIVYSNWIIGSFWIILLSGLDLPKTVVERRVYFKSLGIRATDSFFQDLDNNENEDNTTL